MRHIALLFFAGLCFGQLQSGPPLPIKVVADWIKMPKWMYLGECPGVATDAKDNVWIFNRGKSPMLKFSPQGTLLDAWENAPIVSAHGIRVDPEGNVWTVDVAGHSVKKFAPEGRMLMTIGQPGGRAGNNESKDAFNRPTGIAFLPNGDFLVSDGYENSRVVKFNRDGEYQMHWGKKGTGDGEFNLVHDVAVDDRGRVYVADRENRRVQVFDSNGKFLGKWTDLGSPWGLVYSKQESVLYMCDGYNNRVLKVNLEGQVLGAYGQYGKIPGRFDFAHHIAVDSTGAIYVAEIKNWRVQKFTK